MSACFRGPNTGQNNDSEFPKSKDKKIKIDKAYLVFRVLILELKCIAEAAKIPSWLKKVAGHVKFFYRRRIKRGSKGSERRRRFGRH
jgi:hypothetical protein